MELTEKQRAFIDEYIIDMNATQAAIRAGYSEKTAYSQGQRLLKNVEIFSAIQDRMNEKSNDRIAKQDEILEFLTAVIRGEVSEPVAIMDGAGRQRIEQLLPNVQTRRSAAVDLGKRYAMWTDKQQIDADIGISVVVDYGDTPDD